MNGPSSLSFSQVICSAYNSVTTLLDSRLFAQRVFMVFRFGNKFTRLCALAVLPMSLAGTAAASAQSYSSSDSVSSIKIAALPDAPSALLAQQQPQATPQSQSQKQTPAQNPTAPSLSDLGLSNASDPALQARLDRHTRMLKIHQKLGLITLIPMAAAVISSGGATAKHGGSGVIGGNTTGRDLHAVLGAVTVGMYGATAYYAIAAPRIPESHVKGGIRIHKYLIYIHAPGMVLTPILGVMAFNQLNNGEKVHGIASAHAAVAWTTVASYTAAIIAVSWPIKL
jgi:hypothetical protein